MLLCISPSKTLAEDTVPYPLDATEPAYLTQSKNIIKKLNRLSRKKIRVLMNISDKLARQNQSRYSAFTTPFTPDNAKPAILMFKGDVYEGLRVEEWETDTLAYAQDHLRILSGLYGVLRPMDLMQPYRLEMGTRIGIGRKRSLYEFWKERVTENLNAQLEALNASILVNLASQEYFHAVDQKQLRARIVTPAFKEWRDGKLIMISFFAKKARGLMSRFILENRVTDMDELTEFDVDAYRYSPELSTPDHPVFARNGAVTDGT